MQSKSGRRSLKPATLIIILALAPAVAGAAAPDAAEVGQLRAELEELKAEQAARAADVERLEARLAAMEALLPAANPSAVPALPAIAKVDGAAPPVAPAASLAPRLRVGGDLRLRYENNTGDSDAPDWSRGVLRARLHADYRATDWLTVGGQLATGDPDDPNSTDVTLSNFLDDLSVSLDQAYLRAQAGGLDAWGGKFPLPFTRSDLVWDSDVNPQGIGGTYRRRLANGAGVRAAGLYFLVDQSVAGSDSSMAGAQVGFDWPFSDSLTLDLAAARYDYSLASVAGADTGDFRSNVIGPDGRYVSDFDLIDGILTLGYGRPGDRWPLRVSAEYVYNRGARVDGDTGYGFEISAGGLRQPGDFRISYGYAMAEVDAVLAAFSHDNTTLGSNYRQHSLSLTYAVLDKLAVDAVWYHYRPEDAEFATVQAPDDWLDRIRINLLVSF